MDFYSPFECIVQEHFFFYAIILTNHMVNGLDEVFQFIRYTKKDWRMTMASNNVSVSKKIENFDGMDINVKEIPFPTSSNLAHFSNIDNTPTDTSGQTYTIDGTTTVQIKLVKSANIRNPLQPHKNINQEDRRFYLKVSSEVGFNFHVFTNQHGWKISQAKKPGILSSKRALIAPLLPKKINIWPVRLLLSPFELALKVVLFPVKATCFVAGLVSGKNVIVGVEEEPPAEPPDNTNLEVGDDGDG